MIGLGTIINTAAIIIGGLGGMLFGKNSRKAKYRYNITDIDASSRHILLRYIRKSALKEITRQMTSNAVDYNKKNIFK